MHSLFQLFKLSPSFNPLSSVFCFKWNRFFWSNIESKKLKFCWSNSLKNPSLNQRFVIVRIGGQKYKEFQIISYKLHFFFGFGRFRIWSQVCSHYGLRSVLGFWRFFGQNLHPVDSASWSCTIYTQWSETEI